MSQILFCYESHHLDYSFNIVTLMAYVVMTKTLQPDMLHLIYYKICAHACMCTTRHLPTCTLMHVHTRTCAHAQTHTHMHIYLCTTFKRYCK